MEVLKRKIIIVGAGHVGSHAGYALLSQGLVEEIVYIDIDQKKAEAQALDLYDSTLYLRKGAIVRAGDYSDAKDAQLLIVAAGPLPDMSKGQTRMDTLRQTIEVLKDVTAKIKTSGFSGIILSISNPADVIAHYIQHVLDWPPEKIFSTSTTLDSARLRRAIAQAVGVDQKSVYAYALGEHGESQMVPWSIVTIAGKPLSQLMEERPDTYGKLDLDALDHPGGQRLHRVRHRRIHRRGHPGGVRRRKPRPARLRLSGRPLRPARRVRQRPGGIEPERRGGHHRIEAHRGGTEGVRRLLSDHD